MVYEEEVSKMTAQIGKLKLFLNILEEYIKHLKIQIEIETNPKLIVDIHNRFIIDINSKTLYTQSPVLVLDVLRYFQKFEYNNNLVDVVIKIAPLLQ